MIVTLIPVLTKEVVSMMLIHTHAFVVLGTRETIVKSVTIGDIEYTPGYYDFDKNKYPSSIGK